MANNPSKNKIKNWTEKVFVTDHYSPMVCSAVSLLSFVLVIVMLYSVYNPNNQFPEYNQLQFHTGEVSEIKKTKYSVNIQFNNNPATFKYLSKGNALRRVYEIASQPGKVSVGYDPTETSSPIILDISLNGNTIRSYDEVRQAYAEDDGLVNWLAPIFTLMGIYLGLVAHFSRKFVSSD